MDRSVRLGQYYQADSLIHGLDPRTKLLGTLVFVITLFFPGSWTALCLATVVLFLVIYLSKVPIGMIARGVKPVLPIILFSVIVNLLFTKGQVVFRIGFLTITKEGADFAIYLAIRLIYAIMGSSLMTFTTTPGQLTAGMEKGLGFLKVLHIPVHEFAMMMSIALRFIPILTQELHKIMKAQMSRGVDFHEGNFLDRGKKLVPILIPLFISAIRRAQDLALAMEARCYHGGKGRTRLHPLAYRTRDYLAYLFMGLYAGLMVLLCFSLKI